MQKQPFRGMVAISQHPQIESALNRYVRLKEMKRDNLAVSIINRASALRVASEIASRLPSLNADGSRLNSSLYALLGQEGVALEKIKLQLNNPQLEARCDAILALFILRDPKARKELAAFQDHVHSSQIKDKSDGDFFYRTSYGAALLAGLMVRIASFCENGAVLSFLKKSLDFVDELELTEGPPINIKDYSALGIVAHRAGFGGIARDCFLTLDNICRESGSSQSHNHLYGAGLLAAEINWQGQGASKFAVALEKQSRFFEAGAIYAKCGDWESARSCMERLANGFPHHTDHSSLAFISAVLGKDPLSKWEHLQNAIDYQYDSGSLSEAMGELVRIGGCGKDGAEKDEIQDAISWRLPRKGFSETYREESSFRLTMSKSILTGMLSFQIAKRAELHLGDALFEIGTSIRSVLEETAGVQSVGSGAFALLRAGALDNNDFELLAAIETLCPSLIEGNPKPSPN